MHRSSKPVHVYVIRGGSDPDHRYHSLASGSSVFHSLRGRFPVYDIHLKTDGTFEHAGQSFRLSSVTDTNNEHLVFHTLQGRESRHLQYILRDLGITHTGNAHSSFGQASGLERRDMLRKTTVGSIPYWRFAHNTDRGDQVMQEAVIENMRYPVVISPLPDAFSVDALVVTSEEELREVLDTCGHLKSPVAVSDTYEGNLYVMNVLESFRDLEPYVFPPFEMLHGYDYPNAHQPADGEHRRDPDFQAPAAVTAIARNVFKELHLRDVAQIEVLETPEGELFVLDVDPHPAMDRHSLLSDSAGEVGATLQEVFAAIVDQTLHRTKENIVRSLTPERIATYS